jgi:hypothetical protein
MNTEQKKKSENFHIKIRKRFKKPQLFIWKPQDDFNFAPPKTSQYWVLSFKNYTENFKRVGKIEKKVQLFCIEVYRRKLQSRATKVDKNGRLYRPKKA